MVNFAELKAKAERAKDVSVNKMTNTRDRFSSVPSSKANWDPNWKRAPAGSAPRAATSASGPPPPPVRSRPDVISSGVPPAVPRTSRPTDSDVSLAPSRYTPPPPPTRVASGYPPAGGHRDTSQPAVDRIDWANLSAADKEAFFGWLDEFFSRYLGVEVGPRARGSSVAVAAPSATFAVHRAQNTRPPPMVNVATRPQV
ncbi:hypothetical protein OG21DRAFT_556007 [Imleria badia]|nr:hypothetical protein OG21DRAFT_556007 [Imleria badia]